MYPKKDLHLFVFMFVGSDNICYNIFSQRERERWLGGNAVNKIKFVSHILLLMWFYTSESSWGR